MYPGYKIRQYDSTTLRVHPCITCVRILLFFYFTDLTTKSPAVFVVKSDPSVNYSVLNVHVLLERSSTRSLYHHL